MEMSPFSPRIPATDAQVVALDAVLSHVPHIDPESDKALITSLRLHGQLAPILRRRGQIVDGRRRMSALTSLGTDPWIIDLPDTATVASDAALLGRSFFELNACRRELTLGVRAAIADTLATLTKGSNQHTGELGMSREDAARAVGVSADTLDRYRKIKTVDDVHAKVLAGQMSLPQAVRTVESRAIAARAKTAVSASGDINDCIDQLALQDARFNLIYADPPWDYDCASHAATHCADPKRHYPTMKLNQIKKLPVPQIAAKDSVLWLWTPNCCLMNALEVMSAWDFQHVTHAVWVKRRGVPSNGVVRPMHETLLMGRRGKGLISSSKAMSSVFIDGQTVSKHSRKPTHFVEELERLYPDAGRLELFSRNARSGWVALGNQSDAALPMVAGANDENA